MDATKLRENRLKDGGESWTGENVNPVTVSATLVTTSAMCYDKLMSLSHWIASAGMSEKILQRWSAAPDK